MEKESEVWITTADGSCRMRMHDRLEEIFGPLPDGKPRTPKGE